MGVKYYQQLQCHWMKTDFAPRIDTFSNNLENSKILPPPMYLCVAQRLLVSN